MGVAFWVLFVAYGMYVLDRYANTPGRGADEQASWPGDGAVALSRDRMTLLLLAHPDCPCTRATMTELGKLAAKLDKKAVIHVLFVGISETDAAAKSLVESARAVPGIHVAFDPDGSHAKRFGAWTSGQALLFKADGTRVFAGGITPSRGHEGDNLGSEAIVERVLRDRSPASLTSVFGCSLSEWMGR